MAEQAAAGATASTSIFDSFNRLDARQRISAMVGLALLIALVIGGWLWTREPSYAVLFSNLSERDGGQIVVSLQQQNIPYRFNETGSAILVPGNVVHEARLKLASQGLPKGGLVGFELLENQKLGVSQFAEQINYQRGLEGELSRSIMSLAAVAGARVHLAIPKQTAFLRDEQKPSASVLVSLHPGRVLEPGQVAGIVHLVSSSVPQLQPTNVSVIDQNGNLISQQKGGMADAGLDPGQLKYVRELEADYIKRIENIIGAVVGNANVRAQVAADIDFSQIDQVAETYRPNPRPDTAIRSQQTSESGTTTPGAVGVPGALTNQPPVPAPAPSTTPPAEGAATGPTDADGNPIPQPFSRSSTTNFEVDKTIRHVRNAPGAIRRLSVAVVVNHKKEPGKPKATPLTPNEITQITALAREAMGFNQERGDTLNVANANFSTMTAEPVDGPAWWTDLALWGWLWNTIGKWILIGIAAMMLWKRMLKPTLDRLAAASQARATERANRQLQFSGSENYARNMGFDSKLAEAKDIAKQDPKMVANVIKEWVGGNESR